VSDDITRLESMRWHATGRGGDVLDVMAADDGYRHGLLGVQESFSVRTQSVVAIAMPTRMKIHKTKTKEYLRF
jgi:uncharacterized protein (UPF0261 family)